jgi:hypothetical protein
MNRLSQRAGMPRPRTAAAIAGLAAFVLAVGSWSPVSARSMNGGAGSTSGPVSASGPISLSSVQWMFYKEDFNHLEGEDLP